MALRDLVKAVSPEFATDYVSETTAGLATNVIPATLGNYVKPIGHVLNALAYSPLDMTGSVVTGLLDIDAAKVI